jgi:hypothetical protein
MGRRKKRGRGQWCWCCGRVLANERFSGRNHGRHLCRDCARLPVAEREYRSAIEQLARIWLRSGSFRRKRPQIERFLQHPDPRVQACAAEILRPPEYEVWEPDEPDEAQLELGEMDHRVLDALLGLTGDGPSDDDIPF